MIAALFVETGGAYYGLPDVDPWDAARDARLYAGPHPDRFERAHLRPQWSEASQGDPT